jgi:hypothetical protein
MRGRIVLVVAERAAVMIIALGERLAQTVVTRGILMLSDRREPAGSSKG